MTRIDSLWMARLESKNSECLVPAGSLDLQHGMHGRGTGKSYVLELRETVRLHIFCGEGEEDETLFLALA